jgi:hypothetical protein
MFLVMFVPVAPAHTSILYKRAIVHAIGELHDYNLRSNIDSVRRHVQSTMEKDPRHNATTTWNETIFMKSLKSLIQEGYVEQCTSLNCGLTPEFKRKLSDKALQMSPPQAPSLTGMTLPLFKRLHDHDGEEKGMPVKKLEHYKLKIVPKKIYEMQQ